MSDDHWFSPNFHPATVARKPKPTEPLWTLHKGPGTVDCRLLGHGEYGWETQLYRDGGFYGGRRFDLRAQAIAHGDELKSDLKADGWQESKDES